MPKLPTNTDDVVTVRGLTDDSRIVWCQWVKDPRVDEAAWDAAARELAADGFVIEDEPQVMVAPNVEVYVATRQG